MQEKVVHEKTSSNNLSGLGKTTSREKEYKLGEFINKIHKAEPNTYGNYFVDFGEMFTDQSEYLGYSVIYYIRYMKKNISLVNNDTTEKKQIKNISTNTFLKPTFFSKFSNETLFYIFYYMARDTLQILASEELYKRKWRYQTEYSVWVVLDNSETTEKEKAGESYLYFNFNEWKPMKYVYGPMNVKAFLSENEVVKYYKTLNIDK